MCSDGRFELYPKHYLKTNIKLIGIALGGLITDSI